MAALRRTMPSMKHFAAGGTSAIVLYAWFGASYPPAQCKAGPDSQPFQLRPRVTTKRAYFVDIRKFENNETSVRKIVADDAISTVSATETLSPAAKLDLINEAPQPDQPTQVLLKFCNGGVAGIMVGHALSRTSRVILGFASLGSLLMTIWILCGWVQVNWRKIGSDILARKRRSFTAWTLENLALSTSFLGAAFLAYHESTMGPWSH